MGHTLATSTDAWQQAANVAFVLGFLALAASATAWAILTAPEVEQ